MVIHPSQLPQGNRKQRRAQEKRLARDAKKAKRLMAKNPMLPEGLSEAQLRFIREHPNGVRIRR